jgi:hypothetical protein
VITDPEGIWGGGTLVVSGLLAAFSASVGGTYVGQIAAADEDGDALSYAIAGGADAALLAIDAASGTLAFVALVSSGTYGVFVCASDERAADTQTIAVTTRAAIGEVARLTVVADADLRQHLYRLGGLCAVAQTEPGGRRRNAVPQRDRRRHADPGAGAKEDHRRGHGPADLQHRQACG